MRRNNAPIVPQSPLELERFYLDALKREGSSLLDIENRDHALLNAIGELDPTSTNGTKDKHLSNVQAKVWQDHVEVTNANPHGTDHSQLDNIVQADDTSSSTVGGKHVTDAQLKTYQDHVTADELMYSDTKDPTGWVDPTLIDVAYNSAADTITLTGTLDYYWRGEKRSLTSPWTSTVHDVAITSYFLSSTDGTNFTWSTTPWEFSDLMVAFVQHGATDLFALQECHSTMDWHSHEDAHRTHGTYRQSGGVLADYTVASTTAAFRRPSVSATVVHDEDIETTIPALAALGPYTLVTLTGTGTTTFTVASNDIVPLLANNPYYNAFTTPNWIQTPMANNSYMSVWLVAVPVTTDAVSQSYRYIWIQGQSNGALAVQQALFPQDLNLGQLTTMASEFVFIAKVILRYQGGNWEITSVTSLTGSRALTVGAPSGTYLSLVTTDATLTGDGTVGSPLAVVSQPATTVVTETTASQSSAVGTSLNYAREDHTHGTPASGGGPGAVAITQTEVDFGATPMSDKEFTITDAAVTVASKIIVSPAYEDTTENTADEIIANGVICSAGKPAAGSFTLTVASASDLLSGKYKFNYVVG